MVVSGSLLAVTLGMLANLSLHAKDLGVTGQSTALLYSIIAICSFSGKALTGHLMDRLGIQRCGYLICCFLSSGLLILLLQQNYSGLLAGAFVMGLGYGGVVPLWTNMPARSLWCRERGSGARRYESPAYSDYRYQCAARRLHQRHHR